MTTKNYSGLANGAYESEVHEMIRKIDSLKQIAASMVGADKLASDWRLIDWGNVGDIKRINSLLAEVSRIAGVDSSLASKEGECNG